MSKLLIRPVGAESFDAVHDALLHELNSSFSRKRWRRIVDWGWANPEDHVGYALMTNDGVYVGFAGTIYHDMSIDGRVERFCNITSWYVKDAYRSHAIRLIMPVLSRRYLTITNLTSSGTVNAMFRKLGFAELETHRCRLSPLRGWGATTGWKVADVELLPPRERRIFEAHESSTHSLTLSGPGGTVILILYTMTRRRGIRTANLHYISDPSPFHHALAAVRWHLAARNGALAMEWDARFTKDLAFSGVRTLPLESARLYRSPGLQPDQVPNAFTELPLLNI